VSHDGHKSRDDDQAIQLALFRYGVIARVCERAEGDGSTVTALVDEIAGCMHYLPGRGPIKVSVRTVYQWLARYRKGGIEALRPTWRKDKGSRRAVDEALLGRAVALRMEAPHRTTRTLLDIIKREGAITGKPLPNRATLDRHLERAGASRRQLRILGQKRTIKMRVAAFGDLWVGDYHHGPLVMAPGGKPTTAKLGAFIDHCTRYPVADRYYLSEELVTLRDTMLRGFLRFGPPRRAYVDRGAVYKAEQLAYSLDRVGSKLIHSRAYYSQGRGVIEKWWQVADQFEAEIRLRDELVTIHELNQLWEAWRELRYCNEIHSELGRTPAQAIAEVVPRPLDPAVARELFLVRETRTVGRHDACVPVEGRKFLCESFLRGKRVDVRFDPADLSSVVIFLAGQRVGRAFPQPVGGPPEPHREATAKPQQSVDYLALLRQDYDKKLLEHARPLAYVDLKPDPTFDAARFVDVVLSLAGVPPRPAAESELRAFFDTVGPVPEEIARIGAEHAVRLHGRGRHVRVYLHAIRTLLLAHLKTPPPPTTKESSP
jgi:transposase InsO family protein